MKDVAAAAGVALKTVSRVVNNEPGVAAQTLARVERAIDQLGYRRDESARQLRSGRASSIAIVVRDIADPFFATLAAVLETAAYDEGFVVMVGSTGERADRERQVALAYCARRPDALVLAPIAGSQEYLAPEVVAGLPVVAVDRPAHGIRADAVLSDNAGGMATAVAHLLRRGHRRIGYLGDDAAVFTARERFDGYEAALTGAGLAIDPSLVHLAAPEPAHLTAALRAMLANPSPPTALISGNNRITVEVLRHLNGCPDRPALLGFDDLELADLLRPGLTVIAQDPPAIGRAAMSLLSARFAHPDLPPRQLRVPTRLIARGSAESPPP